jgi:hypothetical protein
LKDFKNKKRIMRTTINYWMKNQQAKAFRDWAQFTLKSKEKELAVHLLNKEAERRNLQRQKDEEEKA